jgi:hypothetical protein
MADAGVKRPRLIAGWRDFWRLWSVRLTAAGLFVQALFMAWGELPLALWNMMPGEVRAMLPARAVFVVPALCFAASAIARIIRQERLNDGQG